MSLGGALQLAILAALAILLIVAGIWLFLNSRQTTAERERKRRIAISRTGRMGDATIIDVRDCILFYSYEVRGVEYTTSQDASEFKNRLPSETANLIGPSAMKYSSKNPANSILICEEWSGLRAATPQVQEVRAKESSHT
jgi:hypothetical protein